MIRAVTTDYLSDAAKMIREEVFMREQGFRHEFDEIDAKAVCLVLYEESKPMACGRYFPGETDGEYVAGRLAVLREYRGRKLGRRLLEEMEKRILEAGGKRIVLSAQVQAEGFYEKQGYVKSGAVYYDEKCEHIHMEKELYSNELKTEEEDGAAKR